MMTRQHAIVAFTLASGAAMASPAIADIVFHSSLAPHAADISAGAAVEEPTSFNVFGISFLSDADGVAWNVGVMLFETGGELADAAFIAIGSRGAESMPLGGSAGVGSSDTDAILGGLVSSPQVTGVAGDFDEFVDREMSFTFPAPGALATFGLLVVAKRRRRCE